MGNLWVETHIPHILYKGFYKKIRETKEDANDRNSSNRLQRKNNHALPSP
jgi:hypothetical protein